jgi:hypothetical protein
VKAGGFSLIGEAASLLAESDIEDVDYPAIERFVDAVIVYGTWGLADEMVANAGALQ